MVDPLEQKVMEFIDLHRLFTRAGRILVAVSGGADSTALLHVLESLRAHGLTSSELICAHVNHRLRGSASDGDERFVVEQATRLGLPVVTEAVDVRGYVQERRLSVETAARLLRLAALARIAKARECTWVAAGHQKDDDAETIIQRLRRGTGFRGLAGIWPARQLGDGLWLARPLLDVSHAEVVAYLNRRHVQWREDDTNADPTYARNYVRHRLLPALQQETQGSLRDELSDLAVSARDLYRRIQAHTERVRSEMMEFVDGGIIVHAPRLMRLPEPVAAELIRQALTALGCGERDLTRSHYEGILQLARGAAAGKMLVLPGGFTVRRDRERLILCLSGQSPALPRLPISAGPDGEARRAILLIPGEIRYGGRRIEASILDRRELDLVEIKGDKGRWLEYLDLDCVRQPVVVRPRHVADRFRPLGQPSENKLGKFLTAARIPQDVRGRVWVFADSEKIVWVCPVRISERVKITARTQRVLVLTVTA